MNDREIKILVNDDSEMSFYRMEGGRWCLIDDSDDALRPYIQEKASSDVWDDAFFMALRQAAFVQDEDDLMIWFEGTDSAYADFRDCLDDCDMDEDIRVKRVKQEKPLTVEGLILSEKTDDSKKTSMGSEASSNVGKKVPEEKEDEATGLLQLSDDEWSWRINYSEKGIEEKEVTTIRENQISEKDTVLINKVIILRANISVSAKIECIHCVIFLDGEFSTRAHIDIMKNGAVWLKHCVVKNWRNKTWCNHQESDSSFLRINSGGSLHIYDSVFQEVSVGEENWLVENKGVCHIGDTEFHKCTGNFFINRAEFCGSWIHTTMFDGCFIKDEHLDSPQKYRTPCLENCIFGSSGVCAFLSFQGKMYRCRFMPSERDIFSQAHAPQIMIHGTEMKSTVDKCTFSGVISIIAEGNTVFHNCEFEKCSTLDGALLRVSYPSVCAVQQCEFKRCICREILAVEDNDGKKQTFSFTLKDNRFSECISDKIFRIGEKVNNIKIDVYDNQFISCDGVQYNAAKNDKSVDKKNIDFHEENNQISQEMTSWVQETKKKVHFVSVAPLAYEVDSKLDDTKDAMSKMAVIAGASILGGPVGAGVATAIVAGTSLAKKLKKKDTKDNK